ncbi:MAG TPA: hypothetical protein DD670_06200 [Planctomycetaceae bacterium]|nr:hypothetical protein [Planctomycetaceae bacterium]
MNSWSDESLRFAEDETLCIDSLLFDRLAPLGERELAAIQELCEAVGPGSLVVDDEASGEGIIVATLPDGRHIVDPAPAGSSDDPEWQHANTRLICRARCFLLRLLNDRRRWREEREMLLARINELEALLNEPINTPLPNRPR